MIVAPKQRGRPRKISTMTRPTLSAQTCVEMIQHSDLTRRDALRVEIAVGLGLFYQSGRVTKDSKDMLTQVYAESGYDCLLTDGKDYKTINRRVNNSAILFERLGYNLLKE